MYELLVGVLVLLVAAYALEKCHGKEGVEDHDKQDVKVSIVVSLPGTGRWTGAGPRAHCGAGSGHVSLLSIDANTGVLQNLLASGEKRKQEGPVHAFHTRITGRQTKQRNKINQKH